MNKWQDNERNQVINNVTKMIVMLQIRGARHVINYPDHRGEAIVLRRS